MKIEKNLSLNAIIAEDNNYHPYVLNTQGIKIGVRAEHVDSQYGSLSSLYIWAYHVKIENQSEETIQLMSRYWRIIDEKGEIQEVTAEGVIGEKPILAPNAIFQYSSGVHLKYPSGIMHGYYDMKKENGEMFKVKIPAFSLDVPNMKVVIN
jgi:ApaG protein